MVALSDGVKRLTICCTTLSTQHKHLTDRNAGRVSIWRSNARDKTLNDDFNSSA